MPRPFHGYNIPIAIQSTTIREYAKKNNFTFSLPITEITKDDCYLMLENMFQKNGKKIHNFALVSGFILPINDRPKLNKLLKNKKINKKVKFHLILENKIFNISELFNWIDDILLKGKIISKY